MRADTGGGEPSLRLHVHPYSLYFDSAAVLIKITIIIMAADFKVTPLGFSACHLAANEPCIL